MFRFMPRSLYSLISHLPSRLPPGTHLLIRAPSASYRKPLSSINKFRLITNMTLANGDNGDRGELEGELNQWKFRAPYRVHEEDPDFSVRYEGSCHCGKVRYQLSREKPLDAKFCHCTTCQKLHGLGNSPFPPFPFVFFPRFTNPLFSANF